MVENITLHYNHGSRQDVCLLKCCSHGSLINMCIAGDLSFRLEKAWNIRKLIHRVVFGLLIYLAFTCKIVYIFLLVGYHGIPHGNLGWSLYQKLIHFASLMMVCSSVRVQWYGCSWPECYLVHTAYLDNHLGAF